MHRVDQLIVDVNAHGSDALGTGVGSGGGYVMHWRRHGTSGSRRRYRYSGRIGASGADGEVHGSIGGPSAVIPLLHHGVLVAIRQREVGVERRLMHRIDKLVVHVNAHGGDSAGAGVGARGSHVMHGRGHGGSGLGAGDGDGGKGWDR